MGTPNASDEPEWLSSLTRVGGDTNGDGDSSGQPGDWGRIYLTTTVTAVVSGIEDVIIRYAGSTNLGSLYIDGVAVGVTDTEISDSSSYGLYVQNAAPDITDVNCHDNATYGMYLNVSDATVTGGMFSDNGLIGIYLRNNSPTLDDAFPGRRPLRWTREVIRVCSRHPHPEPRPLPCRGC